MVPHLIHSQERKDLPFLTRFLVHIMKPGAAFAVTWYGVSRYMSIILFGFISISVTHCQATCQITLFVRLLFLMLFISSRSVQVVLKM